MQEPTELSAASRILAEGGAVQRNGHAGASQAEIPAARLVPAVAAITRLCDAANLAATESNGKPEFGRFNHLASSIASRAERFLAGGNLDEIKGILSSGEQLQHYARQVQATPGQGAVLGTSNGLLYYVERMQEACAAIPGLGGVRGAL